MARRGGSALTETIFSGLSEMDETAVIDLRSDTVTRPTAAMREAMASAEVGDAVIDVDPTVERLERTTAELLGKEAAIFMPSGSMTNQIAIRVHCDRGTEFLCEADSHVYHYEQAAFAQLSGLVARTVAGEHGVLRLEQLQGLIRPENDHMVRTRLVSLENTHNRWGGKVQPQEEVQRICRWARDNDLRSHLDGARLWNAAAATGQSVGELAEPFDSVSVCFSKGLGAPVGSALAGPADFIHQARRCRKLFGGAMRQAGIIAAGALHAVQHHRDRLDEDHAAARRLAEVVAESDSLHLRGGPIETNIVIFEVEQRLGTAEQFVSALGEHGVRCFAVSPQAVRMVTHLDVSAEQIERACAVLRQVADSAVVESIR